MHRRRIAIFAGLLAPLVTAAGCSLINSYDAVKETPGDDATADDAPGDDATGDVVTAPTPDGTMADTSSGGGEASSDGMTVTTSDGPAETTTNTPEAAVDAGLPAGAIVIGGRTSGSGPTNVLAVLNPATGAQESRVTMSVLGVAYDPNTDLWYIFDTGTASAYPATSTSPVVLHVRQLDTRPFGTWAWTELATLSVPQIVAGQYIVPLLDRLVYLSVAEDGGSSSQLTVIDTTNLDVLTADASSTPITSTALSFSPVGILGTPPMAGVGGNLALLQNTASTGDAGVFRFISAAVGAAGVTFGTTPYPAGSAASQAVLAGYGTGVSAVGYQDLFAIPATAPDGGFQGIVQEVTPAPPSGSPSYNSEITFPATGSRFDPMAFSLCSGLAFVAENVASAPNPNLLFAIPISGTGSIGTYTVQANTVSSVFFEPFTNTVVATSDVGSDNFILGLQVGGTGSAPTLANRGLPPLSTWSPPPDLVANWVAVRQPGSCPP